MEISFIIITNGTKFKKLCEQIQTIINQNIPKYEVIVCGDLDIDLLNKKFPDYPIKIVSDIENARKGSLGGLRNSACEEAIFENLVIADDDLLFTPDWYKNLINNIKSYEIMTTCVKNPDGTRFWDNACYASPTKGHINLNYHEHDEHLYMSGGTGWLIKKAILEKIKWDEKILIYSMRSISDYKKGYHNDDTDFALKCREAGHKIIHNPLSVVYHNDFSYTGIGRVIRKRSFMPNFKWALDVHLPEVFLMNFAVQMLQSNVIEGLDLLRKLECDGSINAKHLITNYENSLGGPLENSSFSFNNSEYNKIIDKIQE
jgi:glycosyltransferase involved in cell wall biosynthesis